MTLKAQQCVQEESQVDKKTAYELLCVRSRNECIHEAKGSMAHGMLWRMSCLCNDCKYGVRRRDSKTGHNRLPAPSAPNALYACPIGPYISACGFPVNTATCYVTLSRRCAPFSVRFRCTTDPCCRFAFPSLRPQAGTHMLLDAYHIWPCRP